MPRLSLHEKTLSHSYLALSAETPIPCKKAPLQSGSGMCRFIMSTDFASSLDVYNTHTQAHTTPLSTTCLSLPCAPHPDPVRLSSWNAPRLDFLGRNCCGNDTFDPSLTAPTCTIDANGDDSATVTWIVSVVASVVAVGLLAFCALRRSKRKKNGGLAQ